MIGRIAVAVVSLSLLAACGGGSDSSDEANAEGFTPLHDGILTVATVFPAPGVMEGDTPDTLDGGVDWALSNELSKRLGTEKVDFVNVNFAALIAGQVSDYDIATANISATGDRKAVNDYTGCFFTPVNAALVRSGKPISSLADAKKLKWGVLTGSVNETILNEGIKPDQDARSYPTPVAMTAALQDGTIDAEYISLQRVAADAKTEGLKGNSTIVRMGPEDAEKYGACSAVQLPKGSKNLKVVSDAVQSIVDDGLVDEWAAKYVTPLYSGVDVDSLPIILF